MDSIKTLFFITTAMIIVSCSNADPIQKNERYYQSQLCDELKGQIEYVLFDKTRVDCLTNEYAIEVDWAKKWAESIGQSLYYAKITEKKPAVALILSESKADQRHLARLNSVAKELNIKIFLLNKD